MNTINYIILAVGIVFILAFIYLCVVTALSIKALAKGVESAKKNEKTSKEFYESLEKEVLMLLESDYSLEEVNNYIKNREKYERDC